MARSTREKYFMIAVAAAVGVWALDRYALTPYTDARAALVTERDALQQESDNAQRLRRKERRTRRTWARMRTVGIESAPSEAERRMLHALRAWAQEAGIAHLSLRPSRVNRDHGFLQVLVHAGGSGSTAAVAKLLWAVESATSLGVRVDEVRLTPAKPGADELQIELTVSTLCAVPQTEEKAGTARQSVAAAGTSSRGGRQ